MSEQTRGLTRRQEKILRYVAKHIDKYGFQPSLREIGTQFGIISPNGVAGHFRSMERKGYVKLATAPRAIAFDWKSFID